MLMVLMEFNEFIEWFYGMVCWNVCEDIFLVCNEIWKFNIDIFGWFRGVICVIIFVRDLKEKLCICEMIVGDVEFLLLFVWFLGLIDFVVCGLGMVDYMIEILLNVKVVFVVMLIVYFVYGVGYLIFLNLDFIVEDIVVMNLMLEWYVIVYEDIGWDNCLRIV